MLRSASAPLRDGTGYRPDCNADRNVALGPDWTPEGMTSEGDVRAVMHADRTPLSRFWDGWDGRPEPASA